MRVNLDRRRFLATPVLMSPLMAPMIAAAAEGQSASQATRSDAAFRTASELEAALTSGDETTLGLVEKALERIAMIDRAGPTLRSVIEINPEAKAIAEKLDAERKSQGPRGPWHGIPVLVKDNIATADRMETTAGSLALIGSRPARDAFLIQRLRAAGAVILGKTNLSEWANFRSTRSTSGWSARGGQVKNPYILDRNPSGSSSGSAVAVAAGLVPAAIGTETDGSIVSPASHCGIVGLKPTVGLISRTGMIPISQTQDTAGPMTRTVRDAASLLTVLAGPDRNDPATRSAPATAPDYTKVLDKNGLKGARIGVLRRYFGFSPLVDSKIEEALKVLRHQGAILIDPVGDDDFCHFGANEITVMLYEFKAGLNDYLASLGESARVKSLDELIAFNEVNRDREMPFFGQELFHRAQECGPLTDRAYKEALANCRRLSRSEGIDRVMDEHKLDALVAPTNGPAGVTDLLYSGRGSGGGGCSSPAAVAGYPHITVPAGMIHGLPIGLSFFGRAWSEPVLLRLAYAYEQATQHFQPPKFLPYLDLGHPAAP